MFSCKTFRKLIVVKVVEQIEFYEKYMLCYMEDIYVIFVYISCQNVGNGPNKASETPQIVYILSHHQILNKFKYVRPL